MKPYISDIKLIIDEARKHTYATVNSVIVKVNWSVGRRIVEEEQNGENRAAYGKEVIKNLSIEVTPHP